MKVTNLLRSFTTPTPMPSTLTTFLKVPRLLVENLLADRRFSDRHMTDSQLANGHLGCKYFAN
jgi:hypothetical protein